jgi:hypothetical protein
MRHARAALASVEMEKWCRPTYRLNIRPNGQAKAYRFRLCLPPMPLSQSKARPDRWL